MDPPERVQRWLRIAAGRRLHLGLMGTLSFRPAAPWCKQPVLNWLALLPSLSPPFFISLAHFAYLSDSTWISLASLFPSASLSTFLTCFCSFRLLLLSICLSCILIPLSPSASVFLFFVLFFFSQYSVNKVCFMLLNNRGSKPGRSLETNSWCPGCCQSIEDILNICQNAKPLGDKRRRNGCAVQCSLQLWVYYCCASHCDKWQSQLETVLYCRVVKSNIWRKLKVWMEDQVWMKRRDRGWLKLRGKQRLR